MLLLGLMAAMAQGALRVPPPCSVRVGLKNGLLPSRWVRLPLKPPGGREALNHALLRLDCGSEYSGDGVGTGVNCPSQANHRSAPAARTPSL